MSIMDLFRTPNIRKKHSNFNVYLVNQSETTIKDFMFLYITMVPYYNSFIQVYKHVTISSWIFFLCCGGASHWAHILSAGQQGFDAPSDTHFHHGHFGFEIEGDK